MFNDRIKPHRLLKLTSISLVAVWLSSCASVQPAPSSPEVVISSVAPNDARVADAAGTVVRWGGTIASINNTEDGKSVLEIVSRPLYSGGRPIHNDQSAGRFIAETSQFLDPEIVKVGRDMTLVGTVDGIREGKVGEANYRFPVVAIDTYRYWKQQTTLPTRRNYPLYGYGYSRYGYDPYWGYRPYSHYPHSRRYRSGVSGSIGFILR